MSSSPTTQSDERIEQALGRGQRAKGAGDSGHANSPSDGWSLDGTNHMKVFSGQYSRLMDDE